MGVVGDNAHGPADQKFLRRFFQKAAASFKRPDSNTIDISGGHFP
jgi:hypothetical protein